MKTKTSASNKSESAVRLPQRTCIACRQVKLKKELVRLVKTIEGTVEIDMTGRTGGRGAYICPLAACWEKALQGNHLEHTFRSKVTQDNLDRLRAGGTVLLKEMMTIGQGE